MEFGKVIRKIRKTHGLTQQHFGDQLGVAMQTITLWETDKTLPSRHHFKIMEDKFHVEFNLGYDTTLVSGLGDWDVEVITHD